MGVAQSMGLSSTVIRLWAWFIVICLVGVVYSVSVLWVCFNRVGVVQSDVLWLWFNIISFGCGSICGLLIGCGPISV